MPPKSIDLANAPREDLVELIKKLNSKVKDLREQKDEGGKRVAMVRNEYEDQLHCLREQNTLLKDQLTEVRKHFKDTKKQLEVTKAECPDPQSIIDPLQQQITLLSEKIATDEETIADLVRQLEEAQSAAVAWNEAALAGAGRMGEGDRQKERSSILAGGEQHLAEEPIGGSTGAVPEVATATTTPAAATGETQQVNITRIAELEAVISELKDTNSFYSSVVAQQDTNEVEAGKRVKALEAKMDELRREVADCTQCKHLHAEIKEYQVHETESHQQLVALRERYWALKKNLGQEQSDAQRLRDRLKQVELESIAYEEQVKEKLETALLQQQVAALTVAEGEEGVPDLSSLPPGQTAGNVPVVRVQYRDALQRPEDGGETGRARAPSTASASSGSSELPSSSLREPQRAVIVQGPGAQRSQQQGADGSTRSSTPPPANRSQLFQSLPIVPQVRNPTKREKQLLERLGQFDSKIKEFVEYEDRRQTSLDVVERNRAELFMAMKKQLDDRSRELSDLKGKLRGRGVLGSAGGMSTASGSQLDVEALYPSHPEGSTTSGGEGSSAVVSPTTGAAGVEDETHPIYAAQKALREELLEIGSQRDVLLLQVSQLEADCDRMKREIEEGNQQRQSLQEQVDTLGTEKKDREVRMQTIMGKVKEIKSREESSAKERDALAEQLRVLRAQHDTLLEEATRQQEPTTGIAPIHTEELAAQLRQLRRELTEEGEQKERALHEQLEALKKDLSTWKERCSVLEKEKVQLSQTKALTPTVQVSSPPTTAPALISQPPAASSRGVSVPSSTAVHSRNEQELAWLDTLLGIGGGTGGTGPATATASNSSRAPSIAGGELSRASSHSALDQQTHPQQQQHPQGSRNGEVARSSAGGATGSTGTTEGDVSFFS